MKAKRNTRQRGTGSAPVPTPILYALNNISVAQEVGTLAALAEMSVRDITTGSEVINDDELNITGEESNVTWTNTAGNTFKPTEVTLAGGLLNYRFPDGSNPADGGVFRSRGFDPAVRSPTGAWLGVAYEEF